MTDTASPERQPVSPRERRLGFVLILSLALNLLVLGAVAGVLTGWSWRGAPHRVSSGSSEDYGLMAFTKQLPSDRRKEVRKTIKEERVTLRPLFIEVDDNRRDAARLLTAEPFDRGAFEAALDRLAESENKLKRSALGIVLKTSDTLSAEERRKLGEWWEKKMSRYGRRANEGPSKPADKDDGSADGGTSTVSR